MRGKRAGWFACLFVLGSPWAWADGPHIAFHGTEGAYTVTLFSAPDPLVAGPAELNLLVQKAEDSSLVSPAEISGELTLDGHAPVPFVLAPGGAANAQLPGARVLLADAGAYALRLRVHVAGAAPVSFAGTLPVETNHGTRNTVVWALVLPGLLIVLFLVNQYAKGELHQGRKRGGKRGRSNLPAV